MTQMDKQRILFTQMCWINYKEFKKKMINDKKINEAHGAQGSANNYYKTNFNYTTYVLLFSFENSCCLFKEC